jgi:hypothetical protein
LPTKIISIKALRMFTMPLSLRKTSLRRNRIMGKPSLEIMNGIFLLRSFLPASQINGLHQS